MKKFVIIVLGISIAFAAGFYAPDVIAGAHMFNYRMSSLRLLPQESGSFSNTSADGRNVKSLPVVETYSMVIEKLKNDYYGNRKKINERELTYSAIRGMLRALDDPFTRFMDPPAYKEMSEENQGNFTGIGAQLDTNKSGEVFIKEPLPDSPAINAGVKSNDIIIAVNSKNVKNVDIENVVKLIRGPENTKVKLTLKRLGVAKLLNISIMRKIVQFQMVKYEMADKKNKIGYIRLYQFNEKSDSQFNNALSNLEKGSMKGLILDLRGNPGGLLTTAVEIGSRFIKTGPIVIIQERGGRRNNLNVEEEKHNHKFYPLVVLVDGSSASASEIVSGAIKDDGVGTLVGTTTFGKGRVQTIIPLSDGSAVAITTAKYLTPNGTDIHKKGIDPDVYIEASDNFDPTNPKTDIQLSKALDVVKVKLGILPKTLLDEMEKVKPPKKESFKNF